MNALMGMREETEMFRQSGKTPGDANSANKVEDSQNPQNGGAEANVGSATASTSTAPETAPPLKPFSKKGTHMPTKPTAPQNFRNEIPRRVLDIPGAQRKPQTSDIDTSGENKLVVGKEISLSGAISACECLVVEGEVAADLPEAKTIVVSRGGKFKGTASVKKAEISGIFEGDLTVTDLAIIKPGGVVKGSIKYVGLVMEKGGIVDGQLMPMNRQAPPMRAKIAVPVSDTNEAGES